MKSVVLSIHPRYVERIFSGEKRVELRRGRIPSDIGRVVIYATKPIGRLVGEFLVSGCSRGAADVLWERYGLQLGVSREELERYACGQELLCIEVGDLLVYETPKVLTEVYPGRTPPQGFFYG